MRLSGQRIVARLRQDTFASALRQEVEFVEKGEGDVISRLSVDSTIVGESYVQIICLLFYRILSTFVSLTQNLSDGLRAVVMASVGCASPYLYDNHLC